MRRVLLLSVAVAVLAGDASTAAVRPRYLAPRPRDGLVFPVARSNWYSVINFRNDWHEPRMRYERGKWRLVGVHEGVDIFAEPGTPVRAIADGTVERVGWLFYSGWRIGIRDELGRYWFYAHLGRYAPGLQPGVAVEAGDRLGEVGNTGYGATPGHAGEFTYHLHVGIQRSDGRWLNPYPLIGRLYAAAT